MNVSPSRDRRAIPAVLAKPAGHRARRWRPGVLVRYLYLLPMVVLVGAFLRYPAADTFWISFTNWNGLNNAAFIGLENYARLFSDPVFTTSFVNTLLWVVGVLVLQVALGLLMAIVLSNIWGGTLLKTIVYLPATISAAATGVIWYFMFDPNEGVINTFLRLIHLGALAQDWLAPAPLTSWAIVVAATWQGMGPTMMLFLVGLQNIPRDAV